MEPNLRNPLNLLKYLVFIHLGVFIVTVGLALSDGQTFQSWYAIHIVVAYWLLIHRPSVDGTRFFTKLVYLLLIPSIHLYKFFTLTDGHEVPFIYTFLNLAIAATLYLGIPLLILAKGHHVGVKGTA